MESAYGRGRLHLAAAIDQREAGEAGDAGAFVELARLAERGVLDFVTLGDPSGRPGPDASAGADAFAVLARVAPETGRIGLVPAVPAVSTVSAVSTARTEPFAVRAAVATLDRVSRGRAGWWTDVVSAEEEARLFGRGQGGSGGSGESGDSGDVVDVADVAGVGGVADAVVRLWDSGEGDAGIRGVGAGRSGDREKARRVGFEGAGGAGGVEGAGFSGVAGPAVRGASDVGRPPQGHPVRVVDMTEGVSRGAAAAYADVALVRVATPAHADAVRTELRDAAAGFGRDPDELRVLVSLRVDLGGGEHAAEPGHGGGGPRQTAHGPLYRGGPVDLAELVIAWHRAGAADGFHLVPVEPRRDLERLVNGTVALLQHRGLFRTFYPGSTLREHLGLARRPVGTP
ncbi:LLM class flavin-dependent oxidoreductase [Streptomyces sp. NPDC001868]|uniref:LLM class flavin-dependent oxidoreductase n=1 Tax=Streptomyces sp. NPDC001868 TaxID=3154401 RepID=UPI00332EE66E